MKKRLKILGLSYSNSQVGSYVLVLSEIKGDRKLPIIVKQIDAQYIALKVEGISSPRPLTQDLFKNFAETFAFNLNEVYIHEVAEGIFYSKLLVSNAIDNYEIDCCIGDAISLSLSFGCPIYVKETVLNSAGVFMGNDGKVSDSQHEKNMGKKTNIVSVENLEKMLEKALENEEFEIAAQLRDKINGLKK
jgi:uncharacterized protein